MGNHLLKASFNINSFIFYSESADKEKIEKELSLCQEIYFIYSLLTLNLLASCAARLMLMILEHSRNKQFYRKCKSCAPLLTSKTPQKLEVYFGHPLKIIN